MKFNVYNTYLFRKWTGQNNIFFYNGAIQYIAFSDLRILNFIINNEISVLDEEYERNYRLWLWIYK